MAVCIAIRQNEHVCEDEQLDQREITDIKQFVELARRADVKVATIKTNTKLNANGKKFKQTKFKVRGSKYLYTLIVNDATKAKKLIQSLPPTLKVTDI
ncbi:hypothetical protein KL942_000458 [Ogataea angusta]|uniref:Large ribosomal subunit protein eL38 n=1 Tax=Pichia angusta TaxID=870730 RepID=A0AAN6DK64_PICAN|nr:uncharacterized protein KL928_001253 [Ogataea angusta]KAG7821169.1 hypothetical protein KL928_001253 [Ogataea angusta]KAG7826129.1 hypothetical protein KL909_000181 [Ogataea angusta]KAG7832124.1 hypothetical protein KL920_000459 [Ogataea angusta]KAG7836297.1 hypothetical protein KL943_001946 [Ogataea angusta]KAG7843362.1 hypothetical protein KL942_000458 [Ogataea angusta]